MIREVPFTSWDQETKSGVYISHPGRYQLDAEVRRRSLVPCHSSLFFSFAQFAWVWLFGSNLSYVVGFCYGYLMGFTLRMAGIFLVCMGRCVVVSPPRLSEARNIAWCAS